MRASATRGLAGRALVVSGDLPRRTLPLRALRILLPLQFQLQRRRLPLHIRDIKHLHLAHEFYLVFVHVILLILNRIIQPLLLIPIRTNTILYLRVQGPGLRPQQRQILLLFLQFHPHLHVLQYVLLDLFFLEVSCQLPQIIQGELLSALQQLLKFEVLLIH